MRAAINELSQYLQFIRNCKIVFTSPQGQQVLRYLMKKGCVSTPVAATTTEESLRNQGAQRLVLSIMKATHKNESELEQQLEESDDN